MFFSIIVRVYGEKLNYCCPHYMPASLKGKQVNVVTKQRGKIKSNEVEDFNSSQQYNYLSLSFIIFLDLVTFIYYC